MKQKMTRLTSVLLAVIMLLSVVVVPVSAAETFKDVPAGKWYSEAVEYVTANGMMNGVSSDLFDPDGTVTRAMFVTVLARLAKVELDNSVTSFADVPAGKWYTGAVTWAKENGIANGVSSSSFAPMKAINRQDMCAMLARFVNVMNYELPVGEEKTFTDAASIARYAKEAVATCTKVGLIAGYDDGTFRPAATATRAQMAVIMMRLDLLLAGTPEEPVPMPAQSFNGAAGEDMSVSVNAPEGALPADTNMTVSRVTDEARLAAIEAKAGTKVYAAADISFIKDEAEIEPEKAVEVQIDLDGLENLQNPFVMHITDDDNVEYINAEIISATRGGQKVLRFYAKDFSVYAVGDNPSQQVKLLTVTFYDYDHTTVINKQAIRLDQLDKYITEGKNYLFDPGVPSINATQSFEGWVKMESGFTGYGEEDRGWDVSEINQDIKDNKDTLKTSTTNIEWNYCAKVFDVRYVVYHDQAGSVLMTQNFHVFGSNPATVPINWAYVGFKGGQNFVGWIEESGIEREDPENADSALLLGDYPLYKEDVGQIYLNGQSYSLTQTIQVYPYLNTGHTIVYDTLKDQDLDPTSTTFISPDFYAEGERTKAPEKPVRVGYEFVGWYENPTLTQARNENNEALYIDNETNELTTEPTTNGKENEKRMVVLDSNWGTEYVFGSVLNESTKLYARWRAKATTYHISVWQQVPEDVVDEDNLNNKYAYYEPTTVDVVLNATTGDKVSLAEAYKLLGNQNDSATTYGEMGYYFVFNEARSNQENEGGTVTVKGDGSTVLNAYYDRKLITISFYTDSNMNTLWSGGDDSYIPAENGAYYHYTAPYETGYYLCGTGPDTSKHPTVSNSAVNLYGYYWGYASISGTSASGYTSVNGNTPANPNSNVSAYGSTDTGRVVISNEGYYYERTGNYSSSYRYFPIYYSYTAPYASGYYAVGTGPDPTAAGTHNKKPFTNPMIGLYQAPLNNWPTEPGAGQEWKYTDAEDGQTYGISVRDCFDIPDNTHTTEWKLYATAESSTTFKTIHWMVENVDDNNFTEKTSSNLGNGVTQYYDNNKFLGFNAYGHNLSANSTTSGFVAYTKGAGISYDNAGNNAYIYFKRRTNNFIYISNGEEIKTVSNVKYQAKLDSFGTYEPEEADTPEGYYFDGWYADPGCTEEFVFTGNKMPEREVAIYAKWVQIRFRVVFEPRGDQVDSIQPSEIVIPNGQSTTFRIDYGETVQGANFDLATYAGHTLLGWYLDTNPNNDTVYDSPFNFGMPMTTNDGMADMTYADAEVRSGVDPWKENKAYDDADGEHDDVVGKITIYARWRENPDGVAGINVRYVTTDSDGHTGKMANGQTEWEDPNIYADQARAFAQPASDPDDDTLQFLYWEILNADGEVVGKAYPGKLFDVHMADAKVTDLTAQAVYVTAPESVPYEPANAQMVQPEPEIKDEEPTREPVRAGTHTYRAVTQLTPGRKYLITYVGSNTTYIMTDKYYGTYTNRPAWTSISRSSSSDTITGDYDNYLFGVQYVQGYYLIGNLSRYTYLSLQSSGYYYPYFGADTSSDNTAMYSFWQYNTSSKTLKNYAVNRYLYQSNSGYFTSNTSADTITFFELDENEITDGNEYHRVNEIHAGDKIVIAHEDKALGNTVLNAGHFIDSVNVLHNVTANESVTVAITDDSNVKWEVIDSGSNDGYYLKNVANGQYLGYDSNHYLTLVNGTGSAYLWSYDSDTLDLINNDETYKYLMYSDAFVDFDTDSNGSQDIRIYAETRSHTVTFVDGCPGANNAVIATVQVEDGKAATAPEAPAHDGYVFDHWDIAFSNVTEDLTVTAVYESIEDRTYTVTFRFMNSQGEWVSESQPVKHGNAAIAPTVPTPPSGYTFNSWDKRFSSITSSLTINAVYKMIPTKKYTVTLRAKYGLANKNATTHIYWYANNGTEEHNGAGARQENVGLQINAAVLAPTPSTFTYTTTRATETGLEYVGHEFLGWARIENDSGTGEKAHPELTEENLYLKWVVNDQGVGHYEVKDPENGFNDWTTVTKVAADEMRPYHDMYAVWSSHVFFVYHSSNGKLQAFNLPTSTEASGSMVGTFDMTALVEPGYLYGGYYKTYGGVKMDAVKKAATAVGSTGWNAGTLVSPNFTELAELNTASMTAVNFEKYTGNSATSTNNDGATFWTKGDAYNTDELPEGMTAADVNGETMKPKADAIYYLKEVPADIYLHSKYVFICTLANPGPGDYPEPGDGNTVSVDDLYLLTVVDDKNYKDEGFRTGADYEAASQADLTSRTALTRTFKIYQRPSADGTIPERSETYTATALCNQKGWIATLSAKDLLKSNFTMIPTWKTLDGVEVGNAPLDLKCGDVDVTSSDTIVPVTEKDSMIYVDCSYYDWWLDSVATIKIEAYGDNNAKCWVEFEQLPGTDILRFKKPEGMNGFRMLRYNKENENQIWNKSVYISFVDPNYGDKFNCIVSFNYTDGTWDGTDNDNVNRKIYIP